MFSSNTSGPGAATDPQFNYVTMLLPGNGTNGAQNNTFLDSSTNNFTITRNGNTTQGTFSPYGSNWSNYFDGNGDELTFTTIAVGSSTAFCCEAWVYVNSLAANMVLFGGPSDSTGGADNVQLAIESNGTVGAYFGGSYPSSAAGVITVGVWYHIAWTRSGTTGKIFVNGVEVASGSSTSAGNINRIGSIGSIGTRKWFNGYVSNARIVVGSAVYTSAFTPSTTPLTAITNTQLLTCQANRFRDASTNNFTITRTGDVSVQRFSPFNPTTPYAAGTDGGSGYFDGSGDYLTLAPGAAFAFGTGDFTVETFFLTTSSSIQYLFDARNSGQTGTWAFQLTPSTGNIVWFNGSADWTVNTTINLNSWNHIAYVRSGTTGSLYLNGVRLSTQTDSTNYSVSPTTSYIGSRYSATEQFTGYMSNVRLLKGTALYTGSTYTVPTSPLTAITNTQLLLNFTNAGIIDNAEMNNLETVGNAQISTTQSKFGGASMYFDGTGDWMLMRSSPNLAFGTGDFTLEMWAYFTSVANFPTLTDSRATSSSTAGFNLGLSSAKVQLYTTSQLLIGATALSANTWYHIAITRSGSTLRIFLNGTQDASTTNSTNWSDQTLIIGATPDLVNTMTGYIDDLRITKGYARYTANFTPPSAPFPDQ